MVVTHFVAQFTHVSRHFGVNNKKKKMKKNSLGTTVLKMWSQICESVHNLWRTLGTTLVLLVYFWDHTFETVFPQNRFSFFTLNSKSLETCVNCVKKCKTTKIYPHESLNFRNSLKKSNFTNNLGYFSTSLRPHYQNSFFLFFFFLFFSKLQDVQENVYLASQIVLCWNRRWSNFNMVEWSLI